MTGLLAAWAAEIVLITYRSAARDKVAGTNAGTSLQKPIKGVPLPSEYVASFIIFGALAFVPEQGQQVATLVGWGLVLATLLNLWVPGAPAKTVATSRPSGTPAVSTTNPDTGVPQKGA